MHRLDAPILVLFLLWVSSIQCTKLFGKPDSNNMAKLANHIYKFILTGQNERIYCSDPLVLSNITGEIGDVNYWIKKITLKGLKNCEITNLRVNTDNFKFEYHLQCPYLIINALCHVNGTLSNSKIDVEGIILINAENYLIVFNGTYGTFCDLKNQKEHLYMVNVQVDSAPKGTVSFNGDLLEGDSLKFELFKQLASENWIGAEELVRKPIIHVLLKKFIQNFGSILQIYSIGELIPEEKQNNPITPADLKDIEEETTETTTPLPETKLLPEDKNITSPEVETNPEENIATRPKIKLVTDTNNSSDTLKNETMYFVID